MARVRMEMNGMVEGWSTKNRFKCLVFFFIFHTLDYYVCILGQRLT